MSWPVSFDRRRISLHVEGRINEEDANRQESTVRELLRRLERQPGLVLADEVGMGKTFVALAVAAAVAWGDVRCRPVVVMVPPSLRDKWPRDFETFVTHCVRKEEDWQQLRARSARTGVEFFRLLDDPRSRRAHIIFLTHGAFHNALNDPWVKLAIIKRALRSKHLGSQRRALPRFAGQILRCASRYSERELFEDLLHTRADRWRDVMQAHDADYLKDDPIPDAIWKVLKKGKVDLSELRDALSRLPIRSSPYIDERLRDIRRSLSSPMQEVWRQALINARFKSPLLVLDEAHHLKNPATRLASLFVEADAEDDTRLLGGALRGGFERMLFLTATPFQLGHHELLSVVKRFGDIRWQHGSPKMNEAEFLEAHSELRRVLDEAQRHTAQLDKHWARLTWDDLNDSAGDPERWWDTVISDPNAQSEKIQFLYRAYERARGAMYRAETKLRPWVIRHRRDRAFAGTRVPRRAMLRGAAIGGDSDDVRGLSVREESLLPFLLSARSQAVVGSSGRKQQRDRVRRTTFAEGLASSYEAFLETRAATLRGRGLSTVADEDSDGDGENVLAGGRDLDWYLERLHGALPSEHTYLQHPKVAPTVEEACRLWELGEKVLIFCHYRATGSALARHISRQLERRIMDLGAERIRVGRREVVRRFEQIGDRFDQDRPLYRVLQNIAEEILSEYPVLDEFERDRIFEIMRRFVRTPAFLVRYFPLRSQDPNSGFRRALEYKDGSGVELKAKLVHFADFLANRCEPDLRCAYIDALERIQTGVRYGGRRTPGDTLEGFELQPSVRRATGMDKEDERRRSLLGFNTPFFPEILVASSVLAEGVDLHLDCRHVIHHDLCWNPSTLEQRTGRIDRIGAKAERTTSSIQVYLPYIAETQDEKMYRVVKDRERWFQVLMGEDYVVDEGQTERLAARVPLPEKAAAELAFKLHVHESA